VKAKIKQQIELFCLHPSIIYCHVQRGIVVAGFELIAHFVLYSKVPLTNPLLGLVSIAKIQFTCTLKIAVLDLNWIVLITDWFQYRVV